MSISSLWSDPRFSSDLLPPISLNSNWCWNLFIQRCIKCFIFRCVNRMIIMITFVVSYAWINLMFHFSVKELFHSNLYLIKTVSSITEKFLGFLISIFAAMKVRTFSYHFFFLPSIFFSFFVVYCEENEKYTSDDRFVVITLFTLLSIECAKIQQKFLVFDSIWWYTISLWISHRV